MSGFSVLLFIVDFAGAGLGWGLGAGGWGLGAGGWGWGGWVGWEVVCFLPSNFGLPGRAGLGWAEQARGLGLGWPRAGLRWAGLLLGWALLAAGLGWLCSKVLNESFFLLLFAFGFGKLGIAKQDLLCHGIQSLSILS